MEKYVEEFTGVKMSLHMAMLLTGASVFALILVAQSIWAAFTPNGAETGQNQQ